MEHLPLVLSLMIMYLIMMSLLYMRMRSVRATLPHVISKSGFAENSFVTSVFRRLDCSLVCPSVVSFLHFPASTNMPRTRSTSQGASLSHTMCAPGHSSCAEQADLSFSCTLAAPPYIPDMPTRKQCVLSRVHACMWRVC